VAIISNNSKVETNNNSKETSNSKVALEATSNINKVVLVAINNNITNTINKVALEATNNTNKEVLVVVTKADSAKEDLESFLWLDMKLPILSLNSKMIAMMLQRIWKLEN